MQRYFEIKNFRNLGIREPQRLVINNTLEEIDLGNVIYLVGPNNSGKSNVLDAIEKFSVNQISKTDIPDFEDSDPQPEIKFVSHNGKATYYQLKTLQSQNNTSGFHYFDPNVKEDKIPDLSQNAINFVDSVLNWVRNQGHNRQSFFVNLQSALASLDQAAIRENYKEMHKFVTKNWGANYYTTYINGDINQINPYIKELFIDENSRTSNIFKDKYGFNLIPNVVKLKNTDIKQAQFVSTPSDIKSNTFFIELFNMIGYNIDELINSYSKFNERKTRGTLVNTQDKINELLIKVAKQFNKLYLLDEKTYRFEVILDANQVNFQIYLDNLTLNFDSQSTGFKWFFNFYITLVSQKKLSSGDIIIMDEPATNLHVKGIEELRDFIREYAKKSKLVFIISTHSPFFIDVDYLENVRIVNRVGNGSIINNKFSLLNDNEIDSLGQIKSALTVGRHILLDPSKKTIFVEGITDYCYLTAFKRFNKITDVVFLPIDGLNDETDNKKLKNDRDLFDALLKIEKYPTLLVDNDVPGKLVKKRADEKYAGRVEVLLLSDLVSNCNEIEDLFSTEDKVLKNFDDAVSFKDKVASSKVSQTTKSNFKLLLERLRD